MRVQVNGVRLYVDADGLGLAYAEGKLIERPPLVLLHGGPGYDHLAFKPWFARFADIAQVLYLDHRGQGHSDESDPAHWTLDQWGDDVIGLCDALDLPAPILLGHSFGGFVALNVATRYPDRLGKLILSSTGAWSAIDPATDAFGRLVGPEAAAAHDAMHRDPSIEHFIEYDRQCNPYYNTTPQAPGASQHTTLNMPLLAHWIRGEGVTFDYRAALPNIACPTLVLCGDRDPVTPVEENRDLAARIPHARLVELPNCGHGTWRDDPAAAERALRDFITGR